MPFDQPRINIAALRGGSGKTVLSLGLIAAWREKGLQIAPFKKGPDFIDAGWLSFTANRSCYNLDPFLMTKEQILESFFSHSDQADISLIEGNRGLYDGLDLDGRSSTAELAKLLKAPVILIVDVTMATRTVAALIKGCQVFDPALKIAGIILNKVASLRQEKLVKGTIEKYCNIAVVGSVPKLEPGMFPERHMGLVPYHERDHAEKAISWAKKTVMKYLQVDDIWKIANDVEYIETYIQIRTPESRIVARKDSPRIGIIRDKAFWFYYPENIDHLKHMGAVLVEINAISDTDIPKIDALYIGGGFPETQALALADNQAFRNVLKEKIEKGLPVYAECGGFMYLGKSLIVDGRPYPMVGTLPIKFVFHKKPQGHGYTVLEVERSNPYYPIGKIVKGHEFHYSEAVITDKEHMEFIFRVKRGYGLDGKRDGIIKKNLLATFTHVHSAGNREWAEKLFSKAVDCRKDDK